MILELNFGSIQLLGKQVPFRTMRETAYTYILVKLGLTPKELVFEDIEGAKVVKVKILFRTRNAAGYEAQRKAFFYFRQLTNEDDTVKSFMSRQGS